MDWKRRINLCKTLLADFRDMIPDESEEEKRNVEITLESLADYTASEAFKENSDDEKEIDSWNILLNAIETCNEGVDSIYGKLYPQPPKYVTQDEAYEKLIEEYAQGIADGDDTVASMNINEWMDANKFVLVDGKDKRRKSSSSSSEDNETVNSRTKF